jgi:hypothetical protein
MLLKEQLSPSRVMANVSAMRQKEVKVLNN